MRRVWWLAALVWLGCGGDGSRVEEATADMAAGMSGEQDAAADADAADLEALDMAPTPDVPPDLELDLAPDLEPDAGEDMAGCVEPEGAIVVSPRGQDGAAGTAAAPLRRIAEALERARPGDTIVVEAGRYAEVVEVTRDGAPGAPITVRAACGARPVIDGAGLSGAEGLVVIEGRAHVVIEGLELTGLVAPRASVTPAGVWVRGASRHITLRDLRVHGIRAHRGGQDSGAHGIAVYGTERAPAEDITIAGCEVYDLTLGWSEAVVINGNVRRFTITDNVVHHVDNIAYDFIGFEPDICEACDQDDAVEGDALNRARRGRVARNVAYEVSSAGNPAYGDTKSAGCFYVDGGADIIIEQNTAYACDIGVELASEWPGKSTRAITVRSNILYRNDVTGIATGGYDDGDGPGGGAARECVVVHNTIVDSSRDGWANTGLLLQNRNINNIYQNNLIVATQGHDAITIGGARNQDNTFSHNLTRGGLDGISAGPGWQTGDPRLEDAAAAKFYLLPGSPALGAGATLPAALAGSAAHDGRPRPAGAPDIGALGAKP